MSNELTPWNAGKMSDELFSGRARLFVVSQEAGLMELWALPQDPYTQTPQRLFIDFGALSKGHLIRLQGAN